MISEVFNTDCLEYMRTLPDKAFQLAIADPPYGIGEDGAKNHSRNNMAKATLYTPKEWDAKTMPQEWYDELRRISRNQIIWGANHFISHIPFDSPCWVVWDKKNSGDFADCELAWTSFPTAVRIFRFMWNGMLQEDMSHKEIRIHPTQKPVALYAWLLNKFAKPEGGVIFDPMMGSQSSRIAAYKLGFDYVGCELDKEYFDNGCERFNRECKGEIKTKDGDVIKQTSLFDL